MLGHVFADVAGDHAHMQPVCRSRQHAQLYVYRLGLFWQLTIGKGKPRTRKTRDGAFAVGNVGGSTEQNTLVAWPGWGAEMAVNALNSLIYQHSIGGASGILPLDFELVIPAPLAYPITMEDLVERWKYVNELFISLPSAGQMMITENHIFFIDREEEGKQWEMGMRTRRTQYLEWWVQERGELAAELIQPRYAHFMAFETQTGGDSAFYTWTAHQNNPDAQRFTDIVFVHMKDEATDHDRNILIAWPGWGTQQVLAALNRHLQENDITNIVLPSALSLPLTIEDVVDRWEDVNELFFSLHSDRRIWITCHAWLPSVTREYGFTAEMMPGRGVRWGLTLEAGDTREAWEQERLERREQYERWWTRERRRRG